MANEGGFLRPILSPPQSLASSTANEVTLPKPRSQPLKSGSPKESMLIRFVDDNLTRIHRRHALRSSSIQEKGANGPFRSFAAAAQELDATINLVWTSGTPGVQIPYLMSIALTVNEFLPEYPPSPKATFRILRKLDTAFASLLQGFSVETGDALPGFDRGKQVNTTEKVRLKSIIDQSRVIVVRAIESSGGSTDAGSDGDADDDDNYMEDDDDDDDDDDLDGGRVLNDIDRQEQGIARIYDKTMILIGSELIGSPIGIITEI